MSLTKQTTIWCDEQGCEEWYMHDGDGATARSLAKRYGWRRRSGFDFCPRHSGVPIAADEMDEKRSDPQVVLDG